MLSLVCFVCLAYNIVEVIYLRYYTVYIIRNTVNSKVYIGQTCQGVYTRFMQHMKPSVIKQRGSYKLYNAINKYGRDKFYYEILEERIKAEDIDNKEIYYIDKFNSFKVGYNTTLGGDSKTISKIDDVELFKEMYRGGIDNRSMADHFGVHHFTITRTAKSLGLTRINRVTEKILIENINKTNIEIAKMLSVHPETVARAFKKFGIPRGKGCSNHLNKQNQKKEKCNDYPVGE